MKRHPAQEMYNYNVWANGALFSYARLWTISIFKKARIVYSAPIVRTKQCKRISLLKGVTN